MNKLAKKGSGIDFGALNDDSAMSSPTPQRPRTGVGAISASLTMGRGIQDENDKLKARLAEVEGREFVLKLDPRRVRPSVWANRHEASFASEEFDSLKDQIASAEGNIQPIKVRPLKDDSEHDFEIAYGHRRHRACLALGLQVLAIVEPLSDQQLFIDMERENRGRQDLSPWEQGLHYRRALDHGLFPSARQLALSTGVSVGLVSGALALANLPSEVVAAFGNPLDLQFRYAPLLSQAVAKDPEGVRSRARKITGSGGVFSPKHVLHELLQSDVPGSTTREFHRPDGKEAGFLACDAKGAVTIKLKPGSLSSEAQAKLEHFLEQLLKG
jgi:ParB family chromosome partitioning protein